MAGANGSTPFTAQVTKRNTPAEPQDARPPAAQHRQAGCQAGLTAPTDCSLWQAGRQVHTHTDMHIARRVLMKQSPTNTSCMQSGGWRQFVCTQRESGRFQSAIVHAMPLQPVKLPCALAIHQQNAIASRCPALPHLTVQWLPPRLCPSAFNHSETPGVPQISPAALICVPMYASQRMTGDVCVGGGSSTAAGYPCYLHACATTAQQLSRQAADGFSPAMVSQPLPSRWTHTYSCTSQRTRYARTTQTSSPTNSCLNWPTPIQHQHTYGPTHVSTRCADSTGCMICNANAMQIPTYPRRRTREGKAATLLAKETDRKAKGGCRGPPVALPAARGHCLRFALHPKPYG